jgi:S-DNA-T family DNA segregation ATPase FtsK/SpoIIIE
MANGNRVVEIGMRRFWGIVLLPLCLFVALSLFSYDWRDIGLLHAPPASPPSNLIGPVGAYLSFALFMALGLAAYLVPAMCLAFGLLLVFGREQRLWPRLVWGAGLLLALASVLELHRGAWTALCGRLNIPDAGGMPAALLTRELLIRWLSPVGTGILAWSAAVVSLSMFVGPRAILRGARHATLGCRAAAVRARESLRERQGRREAIESEQREIERRKRRLERAITRGEAGKTERPEAPAALPPPAAQARQPEPVRQPEPPRPRPAPAPKPKPEPPETEPAPEPGPARTAAALPPTSYAVPPITLLDPPQSSRDRGIQADTATMSQVIVETLADFGIEVEVTSVEKGPVVTRYEMLPAPGVRVERIAGLSNNLALSLKATSVRVQAPIPGKGVVGVEVPNTVANLVFLREILEGEAWRSGKAVLPLAIGKDVGGNDIVADLADMPHLLIAGATGSGKTVCMNSILAGLLMSRTPDQLRLLLIDPKIVEFSAYNELPHLVVPVITDAKKVALGLRWAINEMEKRYKLFARTGVRNIESFNTRVVARQEDLFAAPAAEGGTREGPPAKIPYVVIIIDELADLMLTAQAEIENCVARLAQLSRAVGIHMILATQRPSVNVITGTIKANFPARIGFQVAQKVDSRTILDTVGADKLLGRGDMLFLPPGSSKLVRAQGALTTDGETQRIVEFIRKQAPPTYEVEIAEKLDKAAAPGVDEGEESEELIAQAKEIIRETHRASTSSLQRRLRIGYTRAARIMDILEERGIVGPPKGSDPREILTDLDGEIAPTPAGEEAQ